MMLAVSGIPFHTAVKSIPPTVRSSSLEIYRIQLKLLPFYSFYLVPLCIIFLVSYFSTQHTGNLVLSSNQYVCPSRSQHYYVRFTKKDLIHNTRPFTDCFIGICCI